MGDEGGISLAFSCGTVVWYLFRNFVHRTGFLLVALHKWCWSYGSGVGGGCHCRRWCGSVLNHAAMLSVVLETRVLGACLRMYGTTVALPL